MEATHVPSRVCRGQRTTCKSWCSPSTSGLQASNAGPQSGGQASPPAEPSCWPRCHLFYVSCASIVCPGSLFFECHLSSKLSLGPKVLVASIAMIDYHPTPIFRVRKLRLRKARCLETRGNSCIAATICLAFSRALEIGVTEG